jgi:hypothetical protein
MRRRSSWLRCLRSRRPNDPDDGAGLLGCHLAAIRRQQQSARGPLWSWPGLLVGHGVPIILLTRPRAFAHIFISALCRRRI